MGILVHQEIFHNSLKSLILILTCAFLFSCQQKKKNDRLILNFENSNLKTINGVLLYNNIPFSGVLKRFDDVNQTNNTSIYFDGKKDGVEEKRFLNDSIAEQRYYRKGVKVGIHKSWWQNRILKFEYHFNDKGFYNGTVKEWYQNGQIVKEFNFENGIEKGSQKMWLANGNIKANYIALNGDRFGLIGLKKCFTVKTNDEK